MTDRYEKTPSPEAQAEANYTCTVPDDCETLRWRGQILSMNELAALAQQPASNAPVGVEDLIRRIDAAIERITSGRCTMRVPADPTDPDLVLADAGNWIQRHALAHQPAAEHQRQQPCGCVLCVCEDEKQCHGCGAKYCGNRTDHPAYVEQQPATVNEEMVFRLAEWMAKKDGHDDPHHLIWEGSPPEPWGEVWNRYEDDARSALTAALAAQPGGSDNGSV